MAEQHGKALVPQIRFAGFTDPWEQRKLGQHLKLSRELGHTGVDARKLTVKLWGKGVVEKTDLYGGSAQTQYYIRHAGQFMYGKLDFLHAAFGVVPDKLDCFESTLDSPAFDIEGLDSSFLLNLVTQEDFYLKNGNIANGSRKAKRIHEETFLNMEIRAPELVEQRRIGAFLDRLDSLITLHQRKYDKLCVLKKSMLDKMFPKGGSLYPEIRFAGFTDPWEQRKLGELGFAQSGIGFPDAEQGGSEGIPFFKVSDMNTPGNERELVISNNYVTADQIARMSWHPICQVPAIFFAKVGAAVLLNRKRLVNEPFLLDNNTMAFSMDPNRLDSQFGQSLFERIDLTSLVQVGALPSYNASDVEDMAVSLPDHMDEQRRIGAFFDHLDSLITLHQRKYCGVVSWMLGVALVRLSSEK